jgi:hypothetical protein
MSTEKLIEHIGKRIERRDFLVKLGMGIVATLAALAGGTRKAQALVDWHCCHLCYNPDSARSASNCPSPTNIGQWCWYCDHTDGKTYQCCECKSAGGTCDGNCGNAYASWGRVTGFSPAK